MCTISVIDRDNNEVDNNVDNNENNNEFALRNFLNWSYLRVTSPVRNWDNVTDYVSLFVIDASYRRKNGRWVPLMKRKFY